MTNNDKSRELFERWARCRYLPEELSQKNDYGHYSIPAIYGDWLVWEGATGAYQEEIDRVRGALEFTTGMLDAMLEDRSGKMQPTLKNNAGIPIDVGRINAENKRVLAGMICRPDPYQRTVT